MLEKLRNAGTVWQVWHLVRHHQPVNYNTSHNVTHGVDAPDRKCDNGVAEV